MHASSLTARSNIHGTKVMLCILWDQLGVVYYELLKPIETITGNRYGTQLMRLSRALKDKRPQYQERRDNSRLCTKGGMVAIVTSAMKLAVWTFSPLEASGMNISPDSDAEAQLTACRSTRKHAMRLFPSVWTQSYFPAWQCSATYRKTGQDILGNAEMGCLISPAVLSRGCPIQILLVSTESTRSGSSVFPLLWSSQKMDWFVDRLKRRIVFSRWYPTISRKMKKVVASDRQYFKS